MVKGVHLLIVAQFVLLLFEYIHGASGIPKTTHHEEEQ